MNCKNANQELGFDRFSECDYNLHWSFSNFNRILMVAGCLARLPQGSKVLELGAGSSDLSRMVEENFKRKDIKFVKIDGDAQYESDMSITVLDVTSEECNRFCKSYGPFDAVVFMEVIEHLSEDDAKLVIERIVDWLKPEAMLLLTTPTPPYDGMYEDRVWPTDHNLEFTNSQLYGIINKAFKINKEIGWSLEEREYNKLLESDEFIMRLHGKLRCAFPESYIRAIIASVAPTQANRQVLLVCRKRRIANGRFTQT